jgi:hypothetical protein
MVSPRSRHEALDGVLSLNIFRPAELARGAPDAAGGSVSANLFASSAD